MMLVTALLTLLIIISQLQYFETHTQIYSHTEKK